MSKLRNLTGKASALRAVVGCALAAGAVVAWQQGAMGVALGLGGTGLAAMLSGLLGYCPACARAGRCRLPGAGQ